jgi:hypothetical protein
MTGRGAFTILVWGYRTLQLEQLSSIALRWAQIWKDHGQFLIQLALINTALTLLNETVVRELISHLGAGSELFSHMGFFQSSSQSYGFAINRQALINIGMTLGASLFGGPVFFFNQARSRFLFFVVFGFFNSAFFQTISWILLSGEHEVIQASRLLFDVAYLVTIKFWMFERFRMPIQFALRRPLRLGFLRIQQDFLLTALRVLLLGLLGLKR